MIYHFNEEFFKKYWVLITVAAWYLLFTFICMSVTWPIDYSPNAVAFRLLSVVVLAFMLFGSFMYVDTH